MANSALNRDKRQLYVVWTKHVDGWFPSEPMTLIAADKLSTEFDEQGQMFRVVPKPGVLMADILE